MSEHSVFNDSEMELIDAARLILADGVRRVQGRKSLLPTSRRRDIGNECREARDVLAEHLKATYGTLRHEVAVVVLIDAQGQLIAVEEFPQGRATDCEIRPRLLAQYILRHDASAILLAHNHPSGKCSPSAQDVTLTKYIGEWARQMEVSLVDHLVLTSADYCSIIGEW
jgi:DNA repair protein RadC